MTKIATPPKHYSVFPSEYKADGTLQDYSWRQKNIYRIKNNEWTMGIRKTKYLRELQKYYEDVEKECIQNMEEHGMYLSHSEICELNDKVEQVKKYVDDFANYEFINYDEEDLRVLEFLVKYKPELFSKQSLNLSIFESE